MPSRTFTIPLVDQKIWAIIDANECVKSMYIDVENWPRNFKLLIKELWEKRTLKAEPSVYIIDFIKNFLPKFKYFDWAILKCSNLGN